MKRYPDAVKKRRERNRNYVVERMTPCIDCGFFDPVCMDFHHLRDKKYGVARMVQNSSSLKLIQEELDKCVCLCSNCHRKRHHSTVR